MPSITRPLARFVSFAACILVFSPPVRADDFDIAISVKSETEKVETSKTHEKRALKKPAKRAVFKVERGGRLRVSWTGRNTAESETFKNVLVHFFIVEEEKVGQEKIPPLDKDVLHEGALTMDFEPAEKATGEFTIRIYEPGSYLLRVETIGMISDHGHDHYAALDLLVE